VDTPTFSTFFALLALACWGASALVLAVWLVATARPDGGVAARLEELRHGAIWLGWVVALVTTLGSLYYSEVAHFVPCPLCWYQRICMYPLSVILLVAAIRRDRSVWLTAGPLVLIGLGFAAYHTQLQAFPDQHSSFCTTLEPCTTRYVWEFGFVSLPFMSLAAFVFVGIMVMLARTATDEDASADDAA
jgi:disulfide bond formation protein DsbB